MTLQRLLEESTLPARGRAGGPSGAALSMLAAALLLFGCGGGGHGTMMAHQPDGGGGAGSPGGGGTGGGRLDGGADATASDGAVTDALGDGAGNDAPIRINVTVDRCPSVLAAASPSMTTLDRTVAVDATADDPDGDPLTYLWSAPSGAFATPTAASTTYRCAKAGEVMLTVTVSDRRCEGQAAVPFTCLATP